MDPHVIHITGHSHLILSHSQHGPHIAPVLGEKAILSPELRTVSKPTSRLLRNTRLMASMGTASFSARSWTVDPSYNSYSLSARKPHTSSLDRVEKHFTFTFTVGCPIS